MLISYSTRAIKRIFVYASNKNSYFLKKNIKQAIGRSEAWQSVQDVVRQINLITLNVNIPRWRGSFPVYIYIDEINPE